MEGSNFDFFELFFIGCDWSDGVELCSEGKHVELFYH